MAMSIVLDYHDSIDGPIPAYLGGGGGINSVEWLDLGRSNLTGTIPDNLGTLPNLRCAKSKNGEKNEGRRRSCTPVGSCVIFTVLVSYLAEFRLTRVVMLLCKHGRRSKSC